GIGDDDFEHRSEIAVIEGVAGLAQIFVVGEDLFCARDIASRAFYIDVVRAKVDGDVQSTFEQVKVLIPVTKQGLQIWSDLKLLIHRLVWVQSSRENTSARQRHAFRVIAITVIG